jgi:amidase
MPPAAYEQALARLESAREKTDRFFERYDGWLLPASPGPAVPLAECGKNVRSHLGPVDYSRYMGAYQIPTAMLGTPVLALPIGTAAQGLPIGVQLHGPRFGDVALVDAALAHFRGCLWTPEA